MKYYFPIHLDGGNRGCEAIAKGTAMLLGEQQENLIGLCNNLPLDRMLGVDKYVTLIQDPGIDFSHRITRAVDRRMLKSEEDIDRFWKKYSKTSLFVYGMKKNDIMISTGGDMMCYGNNEVITTNNIAYRKGIKSILWGCSMGEENLTPEKKDTLHKFSLIYARESLSYDFFKRLGLNNVCMFPDPAFILPPEKCDLPEHFNSSQVVGMNISNYVLGGFSLDNKMGESVIELINHILNQSTDNILLIPHVTWDGQDDRIICGLIKERFANNDRVNILNIDNLNYCEIRYIISNLKLFIGARTHAMISAYSTCVPSIAIGYSIKSRGIAKDLGLDEKLVIDSKKPDVNSLLQSYLYLEENSENIKIHLQSVMPSYIKRMWDIKSTLCSICLKNL